MGDMILIVLIAFTSSYVTSLGAEAEVKREIIKAGRVCTVAEGPGLRVEKCFKLVEQ